MKTPEQIKAMIKERRVKIKEQKHFKELARIDGRHDSWTEHQKNIWLLNDEIEILKFILK